jgi:hypothetical protein
MVLSMTTKINLLKGLLTSLSLVSLMINLEAEDAFAVAVAVPSGAQSTNFGGSPSTLFDTAADQGWLEIDQNGNQVLPFNYINAPSDGFGLTMNSVDQIW